MREGEGGRERDKDGWREKKERGKECHEEQIAEH